MTRPRVHVELVVLPVTFQLLLMQLHLRRRRTAVLLAEQAEERGGQARRVVEGSNRLLRRELLLGHHHATAPAVDDGVEFLRAACGEIRVAPTGARTEDADPAILRGECAQVARCACHVADHLVVGHAPDAAHHRRHVLGRAVALALVQVRADRRVAVVGESPRCLPVPLVPPGEVVDQDDARVRARSERSRQVRREHISLVAGEGDGLREHSLVHVRPVCVHSKTSSPPRGARHSSRGIVASCDCAAAQAYSRRGATGAPPPAGICPTGR